MLHTNLSVNAENHLTLAGQDTVTLAKTYGTPLMVIDENRVRENLRTYRDAMKTYFGGASRPLFASKALSCKYIYRLAKEEGVGIDLVSSGELYTALAAGFDVKEAFFHGNNKTDADIAYGILQLHSLSRHKSLCYRLDSADVEVRCRNFLHHEPGTAALFGCNVVSVVTAQYDILNLHIE